MHDWGISEGYHDVAGRWRVVPPETLAAVRRAMGAPDVAEGGDALVERDAEGAIGEGASGDGPAPPGTAPGTDPVVTYRPGPAPHGLTDGGPWELHTEDGAVVPVASGAPLPSDLPLGYHRLRRAAD